MGEAIHEFAALVKKVSGSYDTLNVFVRRVKPYNPIGRFQTEEESDEISDTLSTFLNENGITPIVCPGDIQGYDGLVSMVLDVLKKSR